MESPFTNLPTDILFDILSRLPLKSISHSRWVCKTWYTLLLTPRFAKIHHSRSIHNKSSCLFFYDSFQDFYLIDRQTFDTLQTSTTVSNLKMTELSQVFRSGGLIRAVNGLVCFSPESHNQTFTPSPLYICNPITGEYVVVSKSPMSEIEAFVSGFGYDSACDDYKVIRIFRHGRGFQAEVYSLSSGIWKVIKDDVPNFTSRLPHSNVFINGTLHWITHSDDYLVLVCFNVETEKFSVIDLPLHAETNIIGGFGVLGECLYFINGYFWCHQDMWLMKDHGKQGSWTKECVIKHDAFCRLHNWGHEIMQLKNSEIVLTNRKAEIGYYNTKECVFRPIAIHSLEKEILVHIRQSVILVGSLVSPKHLGTLWTGNVTEDTTMGSFAPVSGPSDLILPSTSSYSLSRN